MPNSFDQFQCSFLWVWRLGAFFRPLDFAYNFGHVLPVLNFHGGSSKIGKHTHTQAHTLSLTPKNYALLYKAGRLFTKGRKNLNVFSTEILRVN